MFIITGNGDLVSIRDCVAITLNERKTSDDSMNHVVSAQLSASGMEVDLLEGDRQRCLRYLLRLTETLRTHDLLFD